jgi:hypothetical protein
VALPVITDVVRVAFNWKNTSFPSLVAENVMHFRPTAGTAAAVEVALDANWQAGMLEFQTTTSEILSYDLTPLDASGATVHHPTSLGSQWKGTSATDLIPQAAALVKLNSNHIGRSFRGRVYLPWLAEGLASAGVLDNTALATCQAAWTTFLADMVTANCPLVVASYKLADAFPIITATVESLSATQRRRQPR